MLTFEPDYRRDRRAGRQLQQVHIGQRSGARATLTP
jgi:hypothetical protein